MASDPLSFLDSPPQSQSSGKSDPLSFLDQPSSRQSPSNIRDSFKEFTSTRVPKGRDIRADLLTSGTSIAGLPGDLVSLVGGDNAFTGENLRKKGFELFPSLAPKNEQEKEWDEGLSLVMGLATPGGPFKAGAKLIGKGIGKLGGNAAAKALKGKYQELYEIGKNLGIEEKALAPFKHGKVTGAILKGLSKLGDTAKKGVEFAERIASPFYQKLDQTGASLGPLNRVVKNSITRDFSSIIKDIEKSPALVSESKDVIKFLKEASENLRIDPKFTAEGLMSLYKQMNKAVNWSSLRSTGKAHLVTKAKDAVIKGIYGMSPKLGNDFANMNKVYGGYKNLAKEVKPNKLLEYASKGGPAGYFLFSLLTGHDIQDSATRALGAHFGKKALQKISGKLLTSPKWVGIKEKIIKMVKSGSTTHLPKMIQAIKKKAEMESPHIFKGKEED